MITFLWITIWFLYPEVDQDNLKSSWMIFYALWVFLPVHQPCWTWSVRTVPWSWSLQVFLTYHHYLYHYDTDRERIPNIPVITMVKVFFLQSIYNLVNDQAEKEIIAKLTTANQRYLYTSHLRLWWCWSVMQFPQF